MAQTTELLIVDASVIVKWYLAGEVLGDNANALYWRFTEGTLDLYAPDHITSEVASAITSATRGQSVRLTREEGRLLVAEFLELDLATVHPSELIMSAYELVHDYQVSIYDAMYLALASAIGTQVVTADARFYRRVASRPDILWLGDIDFDVAR